MVGMKLSDPHAIVTDILTKYTMKALTRSTGNKTAECMGHMLAGMRVSRYYRVDIAAAERNVIAHEFLLGALSDHAV